QVDAVVSTYNEEVKIPPKAYCCWCCNRDSIPRNFEPLELKWLLGRGEIVPDRSCFAHSKQVEPIIEHRRCNAVSGKPLTRNFEPLELKRLPGRGEIVPD